VCWCANCGRRASNLAPTCVAAPRWIIVFRPPVRGRKWGGGSGGGGWRLVGACSASGGRPLACLSGTAGLARVSRQIASGRVVGGRAGIQMSARVVFGRHSSMCARPLIWGPNGRQDVTGGRASSRIGPSGAQCSQCAESIQLGLTVHSLWRGRTTRGKEAAAHSSKWAARRLCASASGRLHLAAFP